MTADLIRRKFAQRMTTVRGLDRTPQARTIPPVPGDRPVSLSNAQERMWFLHKLDPAASAYNVCVLWHLQGSLNINALRQSAEKLTERHSVFRTLYRTDDSGRAHQQIVSNLPPEWHSEDLRSLTLEQRSDRLDEIAQQASTAPFDLSCRSPLRLVLVATSDKHHVLIMVGQHIVWDGPSFGVFSRELAEAYNLFANNQTDQRPPPPAQYIDFADWHRRLWHEPSAKRDAELAFWKTQLYPLPEPLDFPVDFDRGIGGDEAGDWCTESLDADTTAKLLQLAASEQLTVFEVLIAAIAVLMTRLARTTEVTIGTIASHRNLAELNGVIGNFGNVVPLRLSITGGCSFRQLLQHCAGRCRSAFAHADVPFEYLLDHLDIPRGETRSPLLDTMVTFLSHGMEAPAMEGLNVHWKKHFNGTAQIDLSFDALLQDHCLHLQATWRRSLYRPDTVPNHLRRLAQLVRECLAAPDVPLSQRSLLLPEEYGRLTQSWGARAALPTDAGTLVAWFENTVRKQPDAIALDQSGCSAGHDMESRCLEQGGLSFAALNARANVLARWLVNQGIGAEDRVAIALPRRPEWFVAMLATLKAGACFVPIDPAYPEEYINRVIRLAQPKLSFIDGTAVHELPRGEAGHLPGISANMVAAERAAQQAGLAHHDLADAERQQPLRPAHPVCIVFTSGSSGEPKGVVVTHSALVNLLGSHREDLYRKASSHTGRRLLRVGHAWSLAFDAAWQPTLWMFDGHELHLFDSGVMQDPIALAREIILRRLDFIELTPGMLNEVLPWLQSGLTDSVGQHLPGHVPALLGFGGESVKQTLWQRIAGLDNTTGFNLYGPTETCVDTMIAQAQAHQPPNIGRPVAGAQIYVVDTCLQLAPPGVPGELAIAGAGLARGYLTRGDLTASQFVANPHGAPGSRLYRSGDRVRWLSDGVLDYIGRIDEQTKIRGFRVEPLEVEATVEKIIQRSCAVVARPTAAGTTQLLCFVESGATEGRAAAVDFTPDSDAMRQLCAASLPAHLLPTHFIPLSRLPRLPNGKIDRRSLTMPADLERAQGRTARTPLEQQLCKLMAEVLGREQVSIDEGFFELGGDSISVIRLVSLARRDGITLTARQIFDTRCVARLASQLTSTANGNASVHSSVLPSVPPKAVIHDSADTGLVTPTPLMVRYLSLGLPLQRFAQIATLPLPAGINDEEIEALLNALLQRHAMLRAHLISPQQELPYLEIPADEMAANICVHRLSNLDPAALARQLCDLLNPGRGQMLVAARAQDERSNQQVLWLAVSHLVIDASSWHILAGDLALGRIAQERGEALELPPVPTAWKNWSAGLRLPAPNGAVSGFAVSGSAARGTLASARRVSWTLPWHQGQCPAAAAARRLGLPLASLLPALTVLATFRAGLVPTQHGRTICLAVERHGREPLVPAQDLSRTVGWFAREITVRLDLPEAFVADRHTDNTPSNDALGKHLQHWCETIAQLDQPVAPSSNDNPGTASAATNAAKNNNEWKLGFNFLGDFAMANQSGTWTPQPRMELLVEACGDHWPLLHDLDISACYRVQSGARVLRFDAICPATGMDDAGLQRLFEELHTLFTALTETNAIAVDKNAEPILPATATALKEVTPLQYEMLRQCCDESDPWTTQLELHLESTLNQPITAESLRQGAARLLSRHQALRAGFLRNAATTFIPPEVEPDWQSLDWRGDTTEKQSGQLAQLRKQWYQHRFRLDQPPLLRFMAVRLGDDQWLLLVNCHHLLLDGWSVPRILHEWLGAAGGSLAVDEPELHWTDYLDWLHSQDRSAAWWYWNRALRGLTSPSLLCPDRKRRAPSKDLRDALTTIQSRNLVASTRRTGVSTAALYQLAWANTLAKELGHGDVVFGLFDSGRAAPIDGLTTLVGLVTQLVPLRVDTASSLAVAAHLRALQARQFEWQAQVPVRLDNLEASRQLGELFDTLLVIENALDADSGFVTTLRDKTSALPAASITTAPFKTAPFKTALPMLREQRWHDSIGQVAGLFVYPGTPTALRLCYDPSSISHDYAQHLLKTFKQQLLHLIKSLDPESAAASDVHAASANCKLATEPTLIPTEIDYE